jgi:hypothetical protein
MPKLLAVRYRLFEGEKIAGLSASRNETHDFGGELVLSFQGNPDVFVSWVSEPVQYSIGTSSSSHFIPGATLSDYDVSTTSMWSGLVGQDVSMEFVAPDNQILAVSSGRNRLLLCSLEQGSWWADQVTICREVPTPYGA